MEDLNKLKEKIQEAISALNDVFEDTHITRACLDGDKVLFYEGEDVTFTYTVKEVMDGIGNNPPPPWGDESILK